MNQAEAIPIKKKQLTAEERAAIVGSKRFGAMSQTLGIQFGVSTCCIEKIWKKFREVGSVAQAPGRGRKRITNDRDDRMIAKQVKKDRFVTATEIQANLALRVSQDTIYRRIKETTGFGSYHATCTVP